jgi:hypothetical protein
MLKRSIVGAAAWLEIVVGTDFIIALDVPCRLLFSATAGGVAIPLAPFGGVALVAPGIVCSAFEGRRTAPKGRAGSSCLQWRGDYLFRVGQRRHHVPRLYAVAGRHPTCSYCSRLAATVFDRECAPIVGALFQDSSVAAYIVFDRER